MKKSYTVIKSILAVALAVTISLSAFIMTVSAGVVTIIDEEQKLQYLHTFNESVNAIKSVKPSFNYKKQAGMNRSDDAAYYEIGSKTAAGLSDEAYNYLSVIVDAFFNPDRGLVKNFINVLAGDRSDVTEKSFIKGTDTKYILPKYGEDYVSALTVDDVYKLRVETSNNILNPEKSTTILRYDFPDADIEAVETSSIKKVFDLPSGSIDPVIISGGKLNDSEGPLAEVKFEDFTYSNAYVQAQYDADGELVNYVQNISYTFALSFYDMMRIMGAYTKIDLMEIGLAIANPILVNTGNPETTAREVLRDSVMYIQYDIKMELWNFDWAPRFFGDVDNNGQVTAHDARNALRKSVALEEKVYSNDEALIYSDVDFDGFIKAADARSILRMSVGLEESFSEVPDGKEIKIVITLPEEPVIPEVPENPEEPEIPEVPENPDDPSGGTTLPGTGEITEGLTEFVNTIFDVVNGIKGDNVTGEGIAGLVQKIKDIVKAGNDNPFGDILDDLLEEKPQGGTFIPDAA